MIEYQIWGMLADGTLAYAGVRKARRFGKATAKRDAEHWTAWAQGYCQANPGDYPLHQTIAALHENPLIALRVHPAGRQDLCREYSL